jgi:hypothetical protein
MVCTKLLLCLHCDVVLHSDQFFFAFAQGHRIIVAALKRQSPTPPQRLKIKDYVKVFTTRMMTKNFQGLSRPRKNYMF